LSATTKKTPAAKGTTAKAKAGTAKITASAARITASIAAENRPSREEAEAAVRVLLRWAGDDPTREGLIDTPSRVARSYEEFFSGYSGDPVEMLQRTFE